MTTTVFHGLYSERRVDASADASNAAAPSQAGANWTAEGEYKMVKQVTCGAKFYVNNHKIECVHQRPHGGPHNGIFEAKYFRLEIAWERFTPSGGA